MAPQTRKRNYNQNTTKDTSVENPTSEEKRKLPVRAKDLDSSDGATPTLTESKGTKVVFGDDDNDNPAPPPVVVPKPAVQVEEDEEDDSDDEAPEAVSTSKMASDIKKSNQAAQKVAQEEAAAQKRKRRERDDFFKQQAEERKKLEEQEKAGTNEEASVEEGPAQSLIQRSKAENAVNLLPAEFLTDSSEDEADEIDDQPEERPRKRRVATVERNLARQERGPKDERVGSTVYRVAKKTDERMAPKLKKHAKSSKDILLKRNRSVTKQRSGFFVR
ncbi:u3 snorna associated [Fusarium pseudocircinatum]|uniref:U3 snorna associated n=1 Tax=Fusarium pseudocircinatum TaxID=56676 RepID=A0A8H5KR67_9HYPO|nr:u3 snorna associated [Fusarium pseudocircinatum]